MRVYKEYEEYESEEIRRIVTTDINRLEEEVTNSGLAAYDFRMFLAYAEYEFNKAKVRLKRMKKQKALEIWDDPGEYGLSAPNLKEKIEAVVDASIEEIIQLEEEVMEKELVKNKIQAAAETLTDKRYGLISAVKLFLANYYADDPQQRQCSSYEEHYEQLANTMRIRNEKKGGSENEV